MSNDSQGTGTRRTFLAGTALGAAVSILPTVGATGSARETEAKPDLDFEVGAVSVEYPSGWSATRATFRDGSFVRFGEGAPERIGSPGRRLETLSLLDDTDTVRRFQNPNVDRDPGEPAVTFTSSRVTVRKGAFPDVDGVPDEVISSVTLEFVDGTSQRPVHYSHDQSPVDVATTYRGTGEHAGKVLAAVAIDYDRNFTRHYLRNPKADKHLLGAETSSERLFEVMGATPGAVDYEFTVDGPVRPAETTDRRKSDVGGNDAITENEDGTWTVTGTTGNPGYGDTYVVNGELQSFEQTDGAGDYVLREAEWRILEDTAPETDVLAVVATEEGEVEYTLVVDGSVRPIPNVGGKRAAEDNDAVTEHDDGTVTVDGFTGNPGYGDTYAVAGDVQSFERTGGDAAFVIEVNGTEVTPDELVAEH